MEYGLIESKYNHMGSLLMKITMLSVLPNYLLTDKEDIIAIKQPKTKQLFFQNFAKLLMA